MPFMTWWFVGTVSVMAMPVSVHQWMVLMKRWKEWSMGTACVDIIPKG